MTTGSKDADDRSLTPYERARAFLESWPGATEADQDDFEPDEHELIFISSRRTTGQSQG